MKTLTTIVLLMALAFCAAAQTTTAPPITVLTMAGAFYDGGSHHAAMRIGGFIPLSDATSTVKTNWLGLVGDLGFGPNSPTSPKYTVGGRYLQKVGTLHFGVHAVDAYLIAAVGGEIQGSTVNEVVKQASGLVTTVAASAGAKYGYQAATGGGLDIKLNSWLRAHPFAEYAHGSLNGSQISVGLMFSGAFSIQP